MDAGAQEWWTAPAMVAVDKLCFCLVVDQGKARRPFRRNAGSRLGRSQRVFAPTAYHLQGETVSDTIFSCAPPMYDELWTAGKCMYKLEPVLADGGELIIYAPHIAEISVTHGELIEDRLPLPRLFPQAMGPVQTLPLGRPGPFDPRPRHRHLRKWHGKTARSGDPRHAHPAGDLRTNQPRLSRSDEIRMEDFANREEEGVLLVPKAGEMLFQLRKRPAWAGGA